MSKKREIGRLKELIEKRARQCGRFNLVSGLEAKHYFDIKGEILLDPEGATLVGKIAFSLLSDIEVKAVGGEGLGGRLIVGGVVFTSFSEGNPIPGFVLLKKEELKHDDPQRHEEEGEYVIKGHFPPVGSGVALFEDVLSTGGSILRAIKVVEDRGCRIARIIVLLDRLLGGSEELRRRGYDFKALLRADSAGNVSVSYNQVH